VKRILAKALASAFIPLFDAWAVDLYREADFRPLTADARAWRSGDSLTVLVMETSSAATTADTSAKRKTDAGLGGTWDFGPSTRKGDASLNASNGFNGAARTQRAGKLLAQITVAVTAVEANGDLRIAGEQLLDINEEQQRIRIEGRVRRTDIGENNAVVSNRIADAKIFYTGQGVLSEGQRPGLIHRVLTWLGL
jgi:flagellar L-ring protein precursor FlgH